MTIITLHLFIVAVLNILITSFPQIAHEMLLQANSF